LTKKAIKVLPCFSYLQDYFSNVSLAHAIMGDGYWDNDSKTTLICTDNFTLIEVNIFIGFLNKKFGLKATIKKRLNPKGYVYRVRFSGENTNLIKIRFLVKDHMHNSMNYKLGLCNSSELQINL
jgi:hypothetical protein